MGIKWVKFWSFQIIDPPFYRRFVTFISQRYWDSEKMSKGLCTIDKNGLKIYLSACRWWWIVTYVNGNITYLDSLSLLDPILLLSFKRPAQISRSRFEPRTLNVTRLSCLTPLTVTTSQIWVLMKPRGRSASSLAAALIYNTLDRKTEFRGCKTPARGNWRRNNIDQNNVLPCYCLIEYVSADGDFIKPETVNKTHSESQPAALITGRKELIGPRLISNNYIFNYSLCVYVCVFICVSVVRDADTFCLFYIFEPVSQGFKNTSATQI